MSGGHRRRGNRAARTVEEPLDPDVVFSALITRLTSSSPQVAAERAAKAPDDARREPVRRSRPAPQEQ